MPAFTGIYRGTVANNIDPLLQGRVQVAVPAVMGEGTLAWAMPCSPYAGDGVGLFTVPPVGANAWVAFEGGNPDFPILVGCFWGTGQVPASPAVPQMKVLKTDATTITVSDLPGAGGVTIESGSPAIATGTLTIKLDAQGITLSSGQGTIAMAVDSVTVTFATGTLKVAADAVSAESPPSKIELGASSVALSSGAGKAEVAASSVKVEAGAGSVAVGPASVNVNNGALEVI
jgi:hypothetical protein